MDSPWTVWQRRGTPILVTWGATDREEEEEDITTVVVAVVATMVDVVEVEAGVVAEAGTVEGSETDLGATPVKEATRNESILMILARKECFIATLCTLGCK